MDTVEPINPIDYRPEKVAPVRTDAPGSVTTMPSPREIHHVHIYSDERMEEMVAFYQWMFNGEIVRENPGGLTFISYDDHDHRIVIIPKEGWGLKPNNPVGVSHLAFAYSSLDELLFVYRRMRERNYRPQYTVNHGNSTSFYYTDPDGNTVETMMDNYTPEQTQDYKRHYQWSDAFGKMNEGDFDPDKMVELYDSGVPDTVLLDREEVRRLVREGQL